MTQVDSGVEASLVLRKSRPQKMRVSRFLTERATAAKLHGQFNAYPDFRPVQTFDFEHYPHWFVGHMSRARVEIKKRLSRGIDVVVEVRDARAPFSTSQFELVEDLMGHDPDGVERNRAVKRLVVFNKADLISPTVGKRILSIMETIGKPAILASADSHAGLSRIRSFATQHVPIKHKTVGIWMMMIGLPNVGKSTAINGLKRLAWSAAKHGHQGLRNLTLNVKRTEAVVRKNPGSTKHVNFFQISNNPTLFCVDTPGVMLLKETHNVERNMNLALINAIPEHEVGELYLGKYLLFILNKRRYFQYVDVLKMSGPTNDIMDIAGHIQQVVSNPLVHNRFDDRVDLVAGVKAFVQLFRNGHLGLVCLDELPRAEDLKKGRETFVTEPPDPWTAQYTEDRLV